MESTVYNSKHQALKELLRERLEHVHERSVLVIGDVGVDTYHHGRYSRFAPEAPIPVFQKDFTTHSPAMAANVALNLKALGAQVTLIGHTSPKQYETGVLEHLLKTKDIDFHSDRLDKILTTTKERWVVDGHLVFRQDRENERGSQAYAEEQENFLWFDYLLEELLEKKEFHAVVVSDYNKGFVSRSHYSTIRAECVARGLPVFVDPHAESDIPYFDAHVLTPTEKELKRMLASPPGLDATKPATLLKGLRDKYHVKHALYTEGGGIWCWPESAAQALHVPADNADEVCDVTGASDTVLACLTFLMARGQLPFSLEEAALVANAAAAVKVKRFGTRAVSLERIKDQMSIL